MAVLDGDRENEVRFLSGVNADGTLAAISYWTWSRDSPATYSENYQSKFGDAVAGTGGQVRYSFSTASSWTPTEQAAFRSAMALWSAVANITFLQVPYGTADVVTITRASDGTASAGADSYYPGRIGTTRLGRSVGDGEVAIDTSVRGFGPLGAGLSAYGGYPWTTLVHELGHVIGLGHGGAYNDGDTTGSAGYTGYDDLRYTIMSYNSINSWGSTVSDGYIYENSPTTPMMLDIAAVQRVYGLPVDTPLSGGQVFGFNSNIGGDIGKFFNFSINTKPIVTLYDKGAGNTLDLSGSSTYNRVSLEAGTTSSVLGLTDNVAIAFGTRIDRYVGGTGQDDVRGNDFDNVFVANGGNDVLRGGGGADSFYVSADAYGIAQGDDGADTVHFDALRRRVADGYIPGGVTVGNQSLFGIEYIDFVDADVVKDLNASAAAAYRLYDAVLGRVADPLGLDNATRSLDNGKPIAALAHELVYSAEFQAKTRGLSDADFVEYLYRQALGRASDADGKQHWLDAIGSGTDRADVALLFSESGEHRDRTRDAIWAGLTIDDPVYQQVAALYDTFADRLPDAQGLRHWVDLIGGGMTLGQVADQFAISDEFMRRTAGLDTAQLVDFLYANTLDRAPDADGRASWMAAVTAGATRGDLIYGFAESDEHFRLIAGNITGGIAVG